MSSVVHFKNYRRKPPYIHFNRLELNSLLGLYATRVARGEWRDYAIVPEADAASFMIFARSNEHPQFVISKLGPRSDSKGRGAARKGVYVLSDRQSRIKQSHSLDEILRLFDQPLRLITG
jgi:hypothetical protein